jgi:hypothetical protein
MKTSRATWVSSVALAGTFACTSQPDQAASTAEHRVEMALAHGEGDAAGDAPDAEGCAHSLCATGGALQTTCDPCTTLLCAQDPYCCDVAWDATCVGQVSSICGQTCTAEPPPDAGASTCAHEVCETGAALALSCNPCVTALCAQDPYCCAVAWDATCVLQVPSTCGQTCN